MNVVAEYLDDVLHRAPMFPDGFEPDWEDHPWQHKVYEGAPRFALPEPSARAGSLRTAFYPRAATGGGGVDLLSTMLQYSYGLVGRRMRITGNPQQYGQIPYATAVWARGSAAGGGLYPCEIYWCGGSSGPGLPGVYHYSPPHHAMNRIALGDASREVVNALGGSENTDQYLLVTVKLWKNAFKYADFCYHSVTMDVGCLLSTWHAIAAANGVHLRPRMWFQEAALDQMLGLDPDAESVFAVVPLPGHSEPVATSGSTARARLPEVERSARVTRWPRVESVHRAAMVEERTPEPAALEAGAVMRPDDADAISLPAVDRERLDVDLAGVLRNRRSSFGRFTASPELGDADFATALAATDPHSDLHPELLSPGSRLTRVVTIAHHVANVPPGVYEYVPRGHSLRLVPQGDPSGLQRHYALSNYNLEQAAALVAIVARPHAVVEAGGARAYRLVNAEVGAVAQNIYMTAAALGFGCGAVLGFDNAGLAEHLGLAATDSWPMLLLMIGHERAGEADWLSPLLEGEADEGIS